MAEKFFVAQRDFSSGEVDPSAKRRDDVDRMKSGARQMRNWRAVQTGAITVRSGRRALAKAQGPRTELMRISGAQDFYIEFTTGKLTITDLTGAVIATNTSGSYLWTDATIGQVVWCVAEKVIVICYPGMQPQTATWTGTTFTFAAYDFETAYGYKQMPFFRFSVPGASMSYTSPASGVGVHLQCSVDYFTAGMVLMYLSIYGQQFQISSVTDARNAIGVVPTHLPDGVQVGVSSTTPFIPGQVCAFVTQTMKMEAFDIDYVGKIVYGTLLSSPVLSAAANADTLVSPMGSTPTSGGVGAQPYSTASTVQWSEEFMGNFRGWPRSCFYDAGRLGFCDFPQKPEAILWSADGDYGNCWVDSLAAGNIPAAGALANSAILEFVSSKPRVRFVAGWGDEFAFTDLGVYQIPISTSNPLKPGSVQFVLVGDGGCAGIRPAQARDAILFVNAGQTRVSAVLRTGSLTTPYILQDITEFHSHLVKTPIALAIAPGDATYPERYVYITNSDGTAAVGKFTQDKQFVGWMPWDSAGLIRWISCLGTRTLSNVIYGTNALVEVEDATLYLDGAIPINAVPTPLVVGGKGPCWPWASGAVTLMNGLLDLGERSVDANGNIIVQQGDDLSSLTLMAGQIFTQSLEPFTPQAQPGQDVRQRQRRRKVARALATVQSSTGFNWCGRDIPVYLFNEDQSQPPPLRESTYAGRTMGRAFDPKVVLTKMRPGPLTVLEIGIEATI